MICVEIETSTADSFFQLILTLKSQTQFFSPKVQVGHMVLNLMLTFTC